MIETFVIFIGFILSAFFSGSETALTSLKPIHIVKESKKKLLFLFNKKEHIISSCVLANNITIIAATLAIQYVIQKYTLNEYIQISISILQISTFFLFAELFPKVVAKKLTAHFLNIFYYFILFSHYTLYPFSYGTIYLSNIIRKLFIQEKQLIEKEDIYNFIGAHFTSSIHIAKALYLLEKVPVGKVMTPLINVFSIERDTIVEDIIQTLEKTLYTRYPIYEDSRDHFIGYIDIKDILDLSPSTKVHQIIKPPVYTFEKFSLDQLIVSMHLQKAYMAFVIDTYGNTIGIVTMEDIAEEVVGEINSEEQKEETPEVIYLSKQTYLVEASMHIDDFNSSFNTHLDTSIFTNINSYLITQFQRFPKEGEKIKTNIGSFIIHEASLVVIHTVIYKPNKKVNLSHLE